MGKAMHKIPQIERFEKKFIPEPNSGCWIWTATVDEKGYGGFDWTKAHRISWKLYVGKIPKGAHVLHKCDIRPCVNPAHLYLGNHTQNMRDKVARGRDHNKSKTHCINGHSFKGENLIIKKNGERRCRNCNNAQQRIRRSR